ncbi:ATP-binding protein [Alkalibacter rhizosphaerae]|uniref:ATP-binding protein n=1 Tax=Alkalibacter rhizosphaerae TaxID=2815577 RepID=A0A974XIH1_9FIRM|nr:ATP-binding protein [Alkalibacter rhizosphaerae]QSX09360.1 ATP-binding protein [Alkalibacter rhizosphaerae]
MENKEKGFRIAVLSGKGGTGKTLVSVNLAALQADSAYVDCDVEEPNGHLYFPMEKEAKTQVYSPIPQVNDDLCNGCRECVDFCRFYALAYINEKVKVFENICHSCLGCGLVCPTNAITFNNSTVGTVSTGKHQGIHVYSGSLEIGKASGIPIIKELLKKSHKEKRLVMTDCPPGSACIVMESIKDADYCVLVAEPTIFGAHNLALVHELVSLFHIPYGVVLNKCTDSKNPSEKYCEENKIPILAKLDFDPELGKLNSDGKIVVWEKEEYRTIFEEMASRIAKEVGHETVVGIER